MSPDNDTPTAFAEMTVDEKLNVIYTLVANIHDSQVRAEATINGVAETVAPMMEKMSKNPMFKMLGMG